MRHRWMIFILLSLVLGSGPTLAASWHVERDGSGDFLTIQEAVDAAAAGDSILIGPGLYTEYQPITLPGWGWPVDVYVYVTVDDLTFIGAGREQTIIGPPEANFQDYGPKGITAQDPALAQVLRVEGIGFRNLFDGVFYADAHADVVDCQFVSCRHGAYATDAGLLVDSCRFIEEERDGVITFSSSNVTVMRSVFNDCYQSVNFNYSTNCSVTDCTILGGRGGIQFADGSNGGIYNCTLVHTTATTSIYVATGSSVQLLDNTVTGNGGQLHLNTNSHAVGSGNVFNGGSYTTIYISHSTVDLHGNHILNAGGYSVLLDTFLQPPIVTVDLSDNYWGTSDAAQIDEWIRDYNDNPDVYAIVDYEPFAEAPIGTEQATWGAIKALYRDATR